MNTFLANNKKNKRKKKMIVSIKLNSISIVDAQLPFSNLEISMKAKYLNFLSKAIKQKGNNSQSPRNNHKILSFKDFLFHPTGILR